MGSAGMLLKSALPKRQQAGRTPNAASRPAVAVPARSEPAFDPETIADKLLLPLLSNQEIDAGAALDQTSAEVPTDTACPEAENAHFRSLLDFTTL